jgi:hypothetical protein
MSRTVSLVVMVALILTLASVAHAQTPTPSPTAPPSVARLVDRNDLRRHVYVMEGALVRAVSFGGQRLTREIKSVVPEMMAVSGEPHARGVYLEGYGVFFDVGVPVLHQSTIWGLRSILGQDDQGLNQTIEFLRQQAKAARSPAERGAIDNTIRRLEMQRNPFAGAQAQLPQLTFPGANTLPDPPVGAATVNETRPEPARTIDFKYLTDPNAINRAYTEAVQSALIDAMLDFGLPIGIAPEEFLTVAARDNMPRDSLAPLDPYEEVVTVLLRIRGSDLAAYRAGQIDRLEVVKRVQIKEF